MTAGTALSSALSISTSAGTHFVLPISPSASTARSRTHQSLSWVAPMSDVTARSSFIALRISIAARRMVSSSSLISSSTASTTRGPPILAKASPARDLTHPSSSCTAVSRSLIERASPISLSTSTPARRAYSESSLSTASRYFTVSG